MANDDGYNWRKYGEKQVRPCLLVPCAAALVGPR